MVEDANKNPGLSELLLATVVVLLYRTFSLFEIRNLELIF